MPLRDSDLQSNPGTPQKDKTDFRFNVVKANLGSITRNLRKLWYLYFHILLAINALIATLFIWYAVINYVRF